MLRSGCSRLIITYKLLADREGEDMPACIHTYIYHIFDIMHIYIYTDWTM